MSNGWKQVKTHSNGWTLHANRWHGSKEYRSPCGVFKIDQLRDRTWRLLRKSTYRDGSPRWESLHHTSRVAPCFRMAEEIKEEGQ